MNSQDDSDIRLKDMSAMLVSMQLDQNEVLERLLWHSAKYLMFVDQLQIDCNITKVPKMLYYYKEHQN